MTYSEAKALIKHYWHMSGVLGGLDENAMIRKLVRKQARIQELETERERATMIYTMQPTDSDNSLLKADAQRMIFDFLRMRKGQVHTATSARDAMIGAWGVHFDREEFTAQFAEMQKYEQATPDGVDPENGWPRFIIN